MLINKHTQDLFQYITIAPEDIAIKYCNGLQRKINLKWIETTTNSKGQTIYKTRKEVKENDDWYKPENNCGDSSFNGVLFKDNRVFLINIYVFEINNNYKPKYLEITDIFNELLKEFNIFHLCLLISKALKNFHRDSTLTEELIPFIKADDERLLPKFRYKLQSNHSRHRKFIESSESSTNRIWNKILNDKIHKISLHTSFREFKKKRPHLFSSYYSLQEREPTRHNPETIHSESLSRSSKRRPRTLSFGKPIK